MAKESGIFGDLDVASAEDDPFAIPDNTYHCFLTEVSVKDTKDGKKKGLALNYKIDEGEHAGKNISEWKNIPNPSDPKNPTPEEGRDTAFLKQRLLSLGVPADKMNSVQPNDLIGTEVYVTVKRNGDYTNVRKVVLASEVSTGNGATFS